jgi:DNA-binding response OmpR family regulator
MASALPLDTLYKARPRILLVDDDPYQNESLSELLTESSFEPACATSGDEALSLCSDEEWDLCIVDQGLPGIQGHQLIGEVKLLQPGTPCILLTGSSSPDAPTLAINSGADGYLTKPVDPEFLLAHIERLLLQRYLLQERDQMEGALQTLRAFRHELTPPLHNLLTHLDRLSRRVGHEPDIVRSIAEIRVASELILNVVDRLDAIEVLRTDESPTGRILKLPSLPHLG